MKECLESSRDAPLYRHLDEERREIRLLGLHPGTDEESVMCDLHYYSLEAMPRYEALSYEWGCKKVKVKIPIGAEGQLDISSNLATALRRIRDPKIMRLLWIDQICINQADLAERASQVALMKDIYENATRVIVWLGNSNETGEGSMEFIREIAHMVKEQPSEVGMVLAFSKDRITSVIEMVMFNTYFERYWIIQEIVLARDALVYWGSESAPWRDVVEALNTIRIRKASMIHAALERPRHMTNILAYKILDELHTVRRETRQAGPRNLVLWASGLLHSILYPGTGDSSIQTDQVEGRDPILSYWHLLRSFRYSKAGDPSDRIYALLGICDLNESRTPGIPVMPNFRVNYERNAHDTYKLYTRALIETGCNLSWLSHAGSPRYFQDLPSWAPDLELPPGHRPDDLLLRQHGLYTADKDSKCRLRFSSDSSSLWCDGVYIDKLAHLTTKMDEMLAICRKGELNESPMATDSPEAARRLYGDSIGRILCGLCTAERLANGTRAPPGTRFEELCLLETGPDTLSWLNSMVRLRDSTLNHRAIFISEKGYVGLVPHYASEGDMICVLFGCEFPVLLRREGNTYRYIGDCYAARMMDGEYAELVQRRETAVEEFELR